MTVVLICFAVSSSIFALAALADARWPDRLSRRGRHLAGLEHDKPNPRQSRPLPPSPPSRPPLKGLERLHFVAH